MIVFEILAWIAIAFATVAEFANITLAIGSWGDPHPPSGVEAGTWIGCIFAAVFNNVASNRAIWIAIAVLLGLSLITLFMQWWNHRVYSEDSAASESDPSNTLN